MYAGRRESKVGVRVHEARHHYPPGSVNLNGVTRLRQVLYSPAGTYFN
jgi:hypothetical protein